MDETTRDGGGRGRWHPERVGDFRLLRQLGRGGYGSVFEAESLADRLSWDPPLRRGDHVAVKLIYPELLREPDTFPRLLREAAVGARVRHPNVVRIFAFDAAVVGSVAWHYLVLELVEGLRLGEASAPREPLAEALVRSLGAQVARGLEALHEAGVVHRDVKPQNILVTASQRVTLVDLGIVHELAASGEATAHGAFLGTYSYAAPEQFGGTALPATDLYSLGVVLYEAATGLQPFAADLRDEVERRHREVVPARAGQVNPQVSPLLEELLGWMLAKSPALRPPSAAAVAEILEQGEASAWWREREPRLREEHPAGSLRRVRVPRPTRLVGRDAELSSLRDAWQSARAGRGGVALVVGEAGAGKSRLVDELAEEIESQPGARVLLGEPRRSAGGGLGAVGNALVQAFGEERLEAGLARHLGDRARLAPALAAAITGLPAHVATAPLAGPALAAAVGRVVRSLAAERPLLLAVEDAHAADADEMAALAELAESAPSSCLLVVATARDTPAGPLAELERHPGVRRVPLSRLPARQVERLLNEALGSEELAELLAPRLVRRSDGNPLFVLQLVRELEERHALRRSTGGSLESAVNLAEISIPGSLREIVGARLQGLAEEDRQLLETAAVEGFSFDPGLIAAVLERKRLAVLQDLARLERRTGLVRAEASRFRFDHHHLQEVLLDSIPPALLAEYHALLAASWAEREGLRLGEDGVPGAAAAFLAPHLVAAADARAAARVILPALDHLASVNRSEDAVALATRAEALFAGRDDLVAEIALRRTMRLDLMGRRGEQREAARIAASAAERASSEPLRARALVQLGIALSHAGDAGLAETSLRAALAPAAEDPRLRTRALTTLGSILLDHRREGEAEPLLVEAADVARASGSAAETAQALTVLGRLRQDQGRPDEAFTLLAEAMDAARRAGDEWLLARAQGNLVRAYGMASRLAEARTTVEAQLALCREIGYRKGEVAALGNLGLVCLEQGDHAEARACFDRQASLSRQVAWPAARALALGHLALVLEAIGEPAAAARASEAEEEAALETGDDVLVARALVRRSRFALNAGDAEAAAALASRARTIARARAVPRLEAMAVVRLALASAAGAAGARDARPEDLEAALATLRRAASPTELAQELVAAAEPWGAWRGDEARAALLSEAADLVTRHGLHDPGPLPAARLEALGRARAPVDDDPRAPILRRAATAVALGAARRDPARLALAGELLDRFAAGLADDAARERFRGGSLVARRFREASQGEG